MPSTLDITPMTNQLDDLFTTSSNLFPRYSLPLFGVVFVAGVYYFVYNHR